MKALAGPLDPRRHTMPMREAKAYCRAIGGSVTMSNSELVFAHPLAATSCRVKANRTEASDRLITWLRQLYAGRDRLREAFGVPEEVPRG